AGERIVPVAAEDGAVGTEFESQPAKPAVVCIHEIRRVPADVAGAGWLKDIAVDPVAEDVVHHYRAAVFIGKTVAKVNQRTGVSMTAARGVGTTTPHPGIDPVDALVVV